MHSLLSSRSELLAALEARKCVSFAAQKYAGWNDNSMLFCMSMGLGMC